MDGKEDTEAYVKWPQIYYKSEIILLQVEHWKTHLCTAFRIPYLIWFSQQPEMWVIVIPLLTGEEAEV